MKEILLENMSKERRFYNMKQTISKDMVPEGFSLSLALVDSLPVIFFGLASIILGLSFSSIIFIVGAIITFISGLIKVIWKIIVALNKKNIWWMFIQMRIVMPIGFIIMIIGFIIACFSSSISVFFSSLLNPICLIFLILGFIGMIMMVVFAIKLDSSNPKSNWIEQICNGISQACFFIGFLIAFLLK